ncbi:MAG: helix-turn-helix domain-containing protein [Pirellulaceae bacterium]|nr:helix-turn-helix domain-containing protein [Pirellulaceae bacterium]
MPTTANEFLKPTEIAQRLGCAVEMILHAINSGRLPAMNVGRGSKRPTWRIHQADFEVWRAANTTGQRREPTPAKPKKRAPSNDVKFY